VATWDYAGRGVLALDYGEVDVFWMNHPTAPQRWWQPGQRELVASLRMRPLAPTGTGAAAPQSDGGRGAVIPERRSRARAVRDPSRSDLRTIRLPAGVEGRSGPPWKHYSGGELQTGSPRFDRTPSIGEADDLLLGPVATV